MREPDGAFSQFSFQVAMQTPLEMAMRIVRAQTELDHREALAALELPVLAIYGGLDPYYPEALAEWIADRARDGRYEIFENSAHARAPRRGGSLRRRGRRIRRGGRHE